MKQIGKKKTEKDSRSPLSFSALVFVEPAGVEPASKHMPDKLSTCVFLH